MTQPIVIFGGSGFIGKALCQEAIKQNIPVISISKHGQPQNDELWMTHPLMTWISADIFKEDSWKIYLDEAAACVNLIGILLENKRKGLTYDKMIVQANLLLSNASENKNCPYLFLSAKGGPSGYVAAKQQAEADLLNKKNPTIIIRSGLVVTKKSPIRYSQGLAIKLAAHLPFIKNFANKVYPTYLDCLVHIMLNEIREPSHKIIDDIRKYTVQESTK